ncbi:MBL fold metallo-hydrolase [Patulibacter sp. NPDC049589]|uniref:ComEC/Rec2 family competence protein n=1 Tax=Patulibacter sp. NPDC049589 TaxID=3154731 RepID=UPI00342FAFB0
MYEIDFLPVGDGKDSGDAIALRFTRPDTGRQVVVVIDAGFQDDGVELVSHIQAYYGTDTVDLAILTHPDGDHIGGMGEVVRGLTVKELWLHDIGAHGGSSLPAAAAVADLITVAAGQGTVVEEAFAGSQAFGGAITILGPTRDYYDGLVTEQLGPASPPSTAKALVEAARGVFDRLAGALPVEIPFDAKEVTPRNNSSMVTLLTVDGRRSLFTADAGVPALDRAWDAAEALGLAGELSFVQVPHHGSRRNASSALLDRILGAPGAPSEKSAFVSVVAESEKHPSGRVVNAYMRRGCDVYATAGQSKWHHHGSTLRAGWSAATPLAPMDEVDED